MVGQSKIANPIRLWRTKITSVSLLVALVMLPALVSAEHGEGAAPAVGPAQSPGGRIIERMKFPPLTFTPPKAERRVLPNGIILYLLEDHELPIFSLAARFRTGVVYEPAEKAGLASLTGHLIRSGGTAAKTVEEINEDLEFMAASVETSIGLESGSASLSCLSKDTAKALAIFADVLLNPAFREEKITKRKDEVREAIRRRNDRPGQVAEREHRKVIYGNHPYGREVQGEMETLDRITREDLIAFHKTYFRPNSVIMGVAGDFKTAEIIPMLQSALAKWTRAPVDFPKVAPVKPDLRKSVNYVFKDITQSHVHIGHLGIERTNPDFFPVMVMNFILGGGSFTSRIESKVRSDEGLAYSVYSYFDAPRDLGLFTAVCETKLESTARAITLMLDEIRRMRETPVSDDELKLAIDSITNRFIFRFTDTASIVSQMVDIEYQDLPATYLDTYVDKVKAVTKADVQRVAQKYLHPDESALLVVGNKDKFDKPLDSFGPVNVITLPEPAKPKASASPK